MTSILRAVWNWLKSLFGLGEVVVRAEFLDDEPERMVKDRLYVVGHPEHPWKAMIECPCNCGAVIELNLAPPARPLWKITVGADRLPTVHPSIWRTEGCRSHFWIRDGRIQWCKEGVASA